MIDDPIVGEVHQARAKLLDEYSGSLHSYLKSLLQRKAAQTGEEPIWNLEALHRRICLRRELVFKR